MTKKIAIVGGGVGGMVSALLLRQKGCDVTIYERQPRLGGRLAFHTHGEWRIDQGPTIVLLPQILLSILEEAGIERARLPLIACDPLAKIHFSDGSTLTKYQDIERQVAEIETHFPKEGNNFRRYMKDLSAMYLQTKPLFLDRVFLKKRSVLSWRNLWALWRAGAHISVNKLAAKYFSDPRLRQAYSLQTLYIGGAPNHTPGLYSLIPYAEQAFGIWYLRGGYATLAEILTEELERRGVKIQLSAEVSGLWTESKRCKGIIIENQTYSYDSVIYNGDLPNMERLLNGSPFLRDRKSYKPSSGCLLVYLMASRRWSNLTAHQFYLPPQFDKQMERVFRQGNLPEHPSYYVFHPQTMEADMVPANHTLMYLLIPVPSSGHIHWPDAAPEMVKRVLSDLEKRALPDLQSSILWYDVRTPQDAQRSGLYDGGSFGIAPTWNQSGMFRPQIVPKKIDGLYAVGASIHPGGGIPIVMQGAKLLTQHLAKEMEL